MNSLNALYFPGTAIYSVSQYPLFLLFPKLHILTVAESNIHGKQEQATDSFTESDFCQLHTPCPLGDDLERFTHLLRDIKNRKDDYAAQLSALTLASMSTPRHNNDNSQQEILSSLLRGNQLIQDEKVEKKNMLIWQARLVLAMSEMLDKEEEEIARQLAFLESEETDLFKELQGEEDDLEEENLFAKLSLTRDNMNPPNPGNMKKRFQSWQQLYNEGHPPYDLLLATDSDVADLIFESFEGEATAKAIHLGQLVLPAIIDWNEEKAVHTARSFQENNSELLNDFTNMLIEVKNRSNLVKQSDSTAIFSKLAGMWEQRIETQFPIKRFGRLPIEFYGFTNTSCAALMGKQNEQNQGNNCIMAVADITAIMG